MTRDSQTLKHCLVESSNSPVDDKKKKTNERYYDETVLMVYNDGWLLVLVKLLKLKKSLKSRSMM